MMDDFDDSIEGAEAERGGKMGLVAVLVAIVGIVVGVTGIVLANQTQGKVKALEAKLLAEPDKVPQLEEKIADLNKRLEKLGGEFVKLGSADQQIQKNTQAAFNEVAGKMNENREGLNQLSEKLAELVEKLETWQPSGRVALVPSGGSDGDEAGAGSESAPGEGGSYAIQSGDTLSRIAQRFGVSLSALMAANPTVDPKRLQIGQQIVIPAN
ncbi:MAG: LysM peptidoglycan-binding domain-containing protein [Oceanipulchritudo sp.]